MFSHGRFCEIHSNSTGELDNIRQTALREAGEEQTEQISRSGERKQEVQKEGDGKRDRDRERGKEGMREREKERGRKGEIMQARKRTLFFIEYVK